MLGCKFHFEKKKENRKKKDVGFLEGKCQEGEELFFLEFGNSMLTRQRERTRVTGCIGGNMLKKLDHLGLIECWVQTAQR